MANDTYELVTTTKAGLAASLASKITAHSNWTAANVGGTITITDATLGTRRFQMVYTSPNNTLLCKMYDGSAYSKNATLTLSTGGDATSAVNYYLLINDDRILIGFSTVDSSSVYTNNVVYFGFIKRFDTSDAHAWGLYVSGAPELMGKNFTNIGIPYGCLETMYMRAITKFSDGSGNPASITDGNPNRSISVTPFMFNDLQGYDGVETDYNSYGYKDNIITGTPTFGGGGQRDIFEEEKFLSGRIKRIGVYREFDDHDGRGLRGTLDLVYHVEQPWQESSDNIVIPKKGTMAPTEVKILMTARGQGFVPSWSTNVDEWVIFPLSNKVSNFEMYNGLNVLAFPKYA